MLKYDPGLETDRKKREGYVSVLQQEGKIDLKRTFGSLNEKELTDMQDAFQRAEGFWKPDRIKTERDPMPSDLSRHLPKDKPFKTNRVVLSGKESHHRPEDNPFNTLSFGDLEEFASYDIDHPQVDVDPPQIDVKQPPFGDNPLNTPAFDDFDEFN